MQIELTRDELDLLETLARRHAIESKHTRDYAPWDYAAARSFQIFSITGAAHVEHTSC